MDNAERRIERSWDDNAAAWTDAVRAERITSRVLVTNAAVLDAVASTGAASVLDVGCGEGWLCRALQERGVRATGFDGTHELVQRARGAGAGEYHVLNYEQFAAQPAAVGGPFDAAVCNYSLLGRDITPVMRGAAAVLTPDGVIIVQTIHPFADTGTADRYEDGWRLETFEAMGGAFRTLMPWYFRTVGSWIAHVRDAGFELERCIEPLHPDTGKPVSLLLVGRLAA